MKSEETLAAAERALEAMLNVSHRLSGCSEPGCHPCAENKEAVDLAKAALERIRGGVPNQETKR